MEYDIIDSVFKGIQKSLTNSKSSIWMRRLFLVIYTVVFGSLTVGLGYVTLKSENIIWSLGFGVVAIICLMCVLFSWYTYFKKRNQ